MWISGILAGIFNMFVNPIALETIAWKYYFVYIALLLAFLLLSFFCYPETRGHTLEQMALIFDGDDAEVVPVDTKAMGAIEEVEHRREKPITT